MPAEITHLQDYTRAKHEVADAVRALRQFFQTEEMPDGDAQCQALLAKLAEDRFNLAVLGQFKRGKSSLMNAIIGLDLLPTGVLPLTSVVTALCYGPVERLLITRRDWALTQELPLDDLSDYVTERGNPGNEKGVITAQVEVPVPFLRRGLYFVDTPGVGSARAANTAATYAFLPEADAVIFVTSADAPLSETEDAFLRDIRQHVRKVFCVVNKMDLVDEGERAEVLDFVRARLQELLGADGSQVYPLSARQALTAKRDRNGEALQHSGLPALEEALESFLAEDRSRVFLAAILERALKSVADTEARFALELQAAQLPADVLAERQTTFQQRADTLAAAMEETLSDLRARLILLADEQIGPLVPARLERQASDLRTRIDPFLDRPDVALATADVSLNAFVEALARQLKADHDRWLADRLSDLQAALVLAAQPWLAQTTSVVDQIFGAAANIFQIPSAHTSAAPEPMPWPETRRVGVRLVHPPVTTSLLADFLPRRWARPVYRRQAEQALQAVVAASGDALREAWRQSIEAQVETVTRGARARFKIARQEIERRISAQRAESVARNPARELQALRQRLESLRQALLEGRALPAPAIMASETWQAPTETVARHTPAVSRPASAFAPDGRTCPICAAQQEAIFAYFAHRQYELSTEESARRAFADAGGFCAVHTWQFQRIASPQGMSLGYAPLIETLAEQLSTLANRSIPEAAQQIGSLIQTTRGCPACALLREVEQAEVGKLLQGVGTPQGREDYRRSAGVCLPHLRVMLANDGASDIGRFLIAEQVRHFEEIAENMRSYTLKREATRRWLQNRDERTAWWRALTQLIGERNVRALWPDEE